MSSFKKRQWQIKNPRFSQLEFKCLSTLRCQTVRSELVFAHTTLGWLLDHDPSPTFRTGDARTRNAIRHFMIILRLNRSDFNRDRVPPSLTFLGLGDFVAIRALGG